MNTELEHLKKMRELLAKGWTQNELARDINGREVDYSNDNAVCFCIIGARYRAEWELGYCPLPSLNLAREEKGIPSVVYWNDDPKRTQADVLAFIDRAIGIEEEPE